MENEHHPRRRTFNHRSAIGAQIEKRRRHLKLSRGILGKRIDVPESVIAKLERGTISPSRMDLSILERLAQELSCDLVMNPKPSATIKTFSDLIRRSVTRGMELDVSLRPYA